jgi:hypothetical protein
MQLYILSLFEITSTVERIADVSNHWLYLNYRVEKFTFSASE